MGRGTASPLNATRVAENGYHYTKTVSGWRLTHRLLAEEQLGRSLRPDERVVFVNKDRTDIRPDNIKVVNVKSDLSALRKRRIDLVTRIEELQGQLADLDDDIATREASGER